MAALLGGILALLLGAGGVPLQRPSDIVKWTAKAPVSEVRSGGTVKLELTAAIESGWHVYAMTQPASGPIPMTIAVVAPPGFQLLPKQIEAPPPVVTRDPTFQADTHYYEDQVTLVVPFAVRSAARPGKNSLPLEISYQACSNRICLRPFTEKLPVEVTVAPAVKGRRP